MLSIIFAKQRVAVGLIGLMAFLFCGQVADAQEQINVKEMRIAILDKDGNPTKVHKKVIINGETKIMETPSSSTGKKVDPFAIFYKLLSDDKTEKIENGKVRVGTIDFKHSGWIAKDKVIEWHSRFVLAPNPPVPQKPFLLYQKDHTSEKAKLDAIPKGQIAVLPMLAPVDEAQKRKGTPPFYEVAFFAATVKQQTTRTTEPPVDLKNLTLDVVYVIDTTASMTELLKGVKDVASITTQNLKSRTGTNAELMLKKGSVRFGLVVYQDNSPGLTPAKLICPLTGDVDEFLRKIRPVEVSRIGSVETKEDVLAGLKMALEKSGWGKTSSRHIVLLGDASAHVDGPKNSTGSTVEGIIELARKGTGGGDAEKITLRAINLHAVQAAQPDDPEDEKECTKQFVQFAKNDGHFQGYVRKLNAKNNQEVTQVASELSKVLGDAYDTLGEIQQGKPVTVPAGKATAMRHALFQLVGTQGKTKDPIQKAWGREIDSEGEQIAVEKVLVLKRELRSLKTTLTFLHDKFQQHTDPNTRDVDFVHSTIRLAAAETVTGQSLGLIKEKNLSEVISNLPLQTRALSMKARDLAVMSEKDFKVWLKELHVAKTTSERLLDKSDEWNEFSAIDTSRYALIHISRLP